MAFTFWHNIEEAKTAQYNNTERILSLLKSSAEQHFPDEETLNAQINSGQHQ